MNGLDQCNVVVVPVPALVEYEQSLFIFAVGRA